ncbi:MAG: hypothetical protein ACLQU2_35170 [Candidatus Binataceae bacterium]
MLGKGSVIEGPSASLELRYTEKPVSGWGGLVAVVKYMDRLGIRTLLQRTLADERSSPNQIRVVDIALGFMVAVLTGAWRFAHVERLRADQVVRGILGGQTDALGDDRDAIFLAAWCAARLSICQRCYGGSPRASCARRRWARCWIWTPQGQ